MLTEADGFTEREHGDVRVIASFRVMGLNLEPRRVSELLELEPTEAHIRGEPRFGKSGRRYSDYAEGLWAWRPDLTEDAPVADHLAALLDVLEPKAAVVKGLRELGLRVDLFVGIFGAEGNFGLVLNQKTLERLGNLGIDLGFDVYCC